MKKILVIQTASIGDVILATAVLEKLHHAYPDAELDFLVKKGMSSLFDQHPFIHAVLEWDKSNKYRNLVRLFRQVRSETYDLVVNIQRYALTGLLTAFSGATETIGFDKNPLSWLFTKRVPHKIGNGFHEIQRNQALIADLTDAEAGRPRLYPGSIPASAIYYTISPASLWFTKQYPAAKWVELIAEMPEKSTVYLLGSRSDVPLCQEIIDQVKTFWHTRSGIREPNVQSPDQESTSGIPGSRIVSLAGELTLLESAALMKGARMNFTNDSAPMHLASAVNAPVTVVYCSTTPDFGFGPLSDDSIVVELRETLSCRPCGLHGRTRCPENHFRCALGIDAGLLRSRL